MTDFEKIMAYYDTFDEWGRLDAHEGMLEFELTMSILAGYLPQNAEILDLGGGPGRYTAVLAQMGHTLHLADLSHTLLEEARKRIGALGLENVKSIAQVNAVDLSDYADHSFDAVLLFGPLYHLTKESERVSCVREVSRVLRPNGFVFASFIPYLAGATGVATRMFHFPDQVKAETLKRVFDCGVFRNHANRGFQEGYYPPSDEVASLFAENGFAKALLRSIRGWGAGREAQLYKLKMDDPKKYEAAIDLINQTADDPSIIEMCMHAMYVGQKSDHQFPQ